MKLRTKLILSLVVVLVLAVLITQGVQYVWTSGLFAEFSDHNIKLLQKQERKQATNLFYTVERAIGGSLIRGEMVKFTKLLESLQQVKGLEEVFLFSAEGVVTHAAKPAGIGRKMDEKVKAKIFSEGKQIINESDKAFEIYTPHRVVADCIRCHTTWKSGEIRGVTYYQFSNEALRQAKSDAAQTLASIQTSSFYLMGIAVLAVVVIFVLGMFVTVRRFVAVPMDRLVEALRQYDVDLTLQIPVQSKDEIGRVAQLLNRFVSKLNKIIGQAQAVAVAIGTNTDSSAASLDEITTSSEAIAALARENADNAQEARELMKTVRSGVIEADEKVGVLEKSMAELSQASDQVSKIMQTIDEIAFQTNLLALNAAVEAARAGEAGAGFGVVADEVRNLALRAAEAARSTSEIVEGTISQIDHGATLVQDTNVVFGNVRDTINQASNLMETVADSSARQRQDIDQINTTLQSIDKATQVNAGKSAQLSKTMSTFQTNAALELTADEAPKKQLDYDQPKDKSK
ncbi:MAG: methyl-accepting chemotaxis protein [Desulfarculaceae bacterium]